MFAPKACTNCIHERHFERRPVCLKHLCYLRLWRVCDDWDGGKIFETSMDGSMIWDYRHEHNPTPVEREYLQSARLSDEA